MKTERNLGQIRLNVMEFYAYHGCYQEERSTGNRFLVDLVLEVVMGKASKTDDLNDALNYAKVYESVKQEMSVPSHLLEHLSSRILNTLFERFPQLERAEICVSKLHPPVDGQVESVSVTLKRSRTMYIIKHMDDC